MSPTQRSRIALEERGYHVEKVEYFNYFSKRMKDLWGFIDLLCVKKSKVLAVQVTGGIANKTHHLNKIMDDKHLPMLELVKSAGIKCELHTWRQLIVGKFKNGNPKKGWVNNIIEL